MSETFDECFRHLINVKDMDEAVWETITESVRLFKKKMCQLLDTLLWTCCTLKTLRANLILICYWFCFDNLTNQIREKFVRLMFWYNLQTWSSKFGLRPICHRPDSMYLTVIRRRAHSPNCQMYLSKWQNVFVQMIKCICPNGKMYLSKWQNVFVQIANVFDYNPETSRFPQAITSCCWLLAGNGWRT